MSVLRGRGQVLDGDTGLAPVSAHELLAGTTGDRTVVPVVHVSPEMVADLHEPRLVISPEYVGRERRYGPVRPQPPVTARPPTHRWTQAVMVALVTAVAVVPLTLMVAHGAPAATGPGGATRTPARPVATQPVRPTSTAAPARAAARAARTSQRLAAQATRAAALADQREARRVRASARDEQRSAAQAARATRRSEAQAARVAREAERAESTHP